MEELIVVLKEMNKISWIDIFAICLPIGLSTVAIIISIYTTRRQNKIALFNIRLKLYNKIVEIDICQKAFAYQVQLLKTSTLKIPALATDLKNLIDHCLAIQTEKEINIKLPYVHYNYLYKTCEKNAGQIKFLFKLDSEDFLKKQYELLNAIHRAFFVEFDNISNLPKMEEDEILNKIKEWTATNKEIELLLSKMQKQLKL